LRCSLLKIDLHVHTEFSPDGKTTLNEAIAYAKRRSLQGIAICDHNTVEGALRLAGKAKGFIVIVGQEVLTSNGHMLALNITKPVQGGLSPEETTRLIHEDGGLAVMAHPAVLVKGTSWRRLDRNTKYDAVEVINSAALPFSASKFMATRYAENMSLPKVAGSDSHVPRLIGCAYTQIESGPELESIVEAVKENRVVPCGGPIPLLERARLIFEKRKK